MWRINKEGPNPPQIITLIVSTGDADGDVGDAYGGNGDTLDEACFDVGHDGDDEDVYDCFRWWRRWGQL